ncbi:hypothetical protein INR49_002256 [Caranx melampygus]|nr:hypothetical protein INR49_002256 [Caranx melampygus]
MWRRLSLLILCCTVTGHGALEADTEMLLTGAAAAAQDAPSAAPQLQPAGRDAPAAGIAAQSTAEPLEDEMDNQENIISQLLSDYDKVKTVSSGSDCVCRCIVRPIKRSDCSRIHDSAATSPSQDYYTVETVTKGTDCKKCVCMAPPSAVNPCEGEYRFKKLQEASKDDIKAFVSNFTERAREKEAKERAKRKRRRASRKKRKQMIWGMWDRKAEHQPTLTSRVLLVLLQKNYDVQLKKNQQQDGVDQQQPTRNKTATQKPIKEKAEPRQPVKDKSSVVIRGVTYYKAEEESYKEEERGRWKKTDGAADASDVLISDQLPLARTSPIQNPGPVPTVSRDNEDLPGRPTQPPTDHPTTTAQTTAATKPALTTIRTATKMTTTSPKPTTTPTTTPQQTTTPRTQPTTTVPQPNTSAADTNIDPPANASPAVESQPRPRSRLSWTESPADQPKPTKRPGVCKDTVASLSDPVQHNSYGQSQVSNSYKLPYSFTGTGHVVFNGAFYYNRAFSRDVIKYDLRHKYVAAWTTLHDAILEEQAHRTQSEVEFAVDESGLWLLYPAVDTEGFHQEVILLTHLRPRDLLPVRSFRTGLRRGHYGNSFLVCGVLYGVDSMERHYANVTYAFDTHTLTHTVPSLAFTNMHSHTSQLAYNPLDKKVYAWDNGHQMMYDVIFAY